MRICYGGFPGCGGKPNSLLARVEAVTSALIRETLPEERQTIVCDDLLAHVVWMAFDGFVINHRIGDLRDMDAIAELMVKLLFGE
ncbi:hypothetical protein DR64_1980 [Paraburkholderia xenovorans LB400]|nr:hypothetical protein [Paraburkholderia xenovorans]AIP31987.1 hypothetical protein DR64_1980 [Paraburkholderia xenovorans LB400]